jgi:hypothetical protein
MMTSTQESVSDSPWVNESVLWVNTPGPHINICFDYGIENFVFPQRTYQFKRNLAIDPKKSIEFHSRGRPWNALLVEYGARVSLLFDHKHGWSKPVAAYPSWSAKNDTFPSLKRLCEHYPEAGETVGTFWGDEVPYSAVQGQAYKILIRNPPNDRLEWQQMMAYVSNLKREYPHIEFHMHGGKSVQRTVGMSIDAFDHPVTLEWSNGRPVLLLPNGKWSKGGQADVKWARLIGESLVEFRRLKDRRALARYTWKFNLKSLLWITRNQDRMYAFSGRHPDMDPNSADWDDADEDWKPVLSKYRPKLTNLNDKWICDVCSAASRCPYSRPGAICIVDGTEALKLSEKFGSRKVSDIIDGISTLLTANASRLEKAITSEQEQADMNGVYKVSPAVTSLANSVFDRAIQMARLLDPQIAGQMSGTRVNVGIHNSNAGAVAAATPQQVMAGVVSILQQHGISPEEATQEQVEAIIRGDDPPVHRTAIEASYSDPD